MTAYALPVRTAPQAPARAAVPTQRLVAEPGPAEMPGDPDIWHRYQPGTDTAPCGRGYHQPRREPVTVPVALSRGGALCKAPECFG